jgi:hypothetical protein
MSGKIIDQDELYANVRGHCTDELSLRETVMLKAVHNPARKLSVLFTNLALAMGHDHKLKTLSADGTNGLYTHIFSGKKFIDENIADYTVRIGSSFSHAVCGEAFHQKMDGIFKRSIQECKDRSELKEAGLLEPYQP